MVVITEIVEMEVMAEIETMMEEVAVAAMEEVTWFSRQWRRLYLTILKRRLCLCMWMVGE